MLIFVTVKNSGFIVSVLTEDSVSVASNYRGVTNLVTTIEVTLELQIEVC